MAFRKKEYKQAVSRASEGTFEFPEVSSLLISALRRNSFFVRCVIK